MLHVTPLVFLALLGCGVAEECQGQNCDFKSNSLLQQRQNAANSSAANLEEDGETRVAHAVSLEACEDLSGVYDSKHGVVTLTQSACSGVADDGWTYTVSGDTATLTLADGRNTGITGTINKSINPVEIAWSNDVVYTKKACADMSGVYDTSEGVVTLRQDGCSGSASSGWTYTVSANVATKTPAGGADASVTGTIDKAARPVSITWSDGGTYTLKTECARKYAGLMARKPLPPRGFSNPDEAFKFSDIDGNDLVTLEELKINTLGLQSGEYEDDPEFALSSAMRVIREKIAAVDVDQNNIITRDEFEAAVARAVLEGEVEATVMLLDDAIDRLLSNKSGIQLITARATVRAEATPSRWAWEPRKVPRRNQGAQHPDADGVVNSVYTFGAPGTADPSLVNALRGDGCFPGIRAYNSESRRGVILGSSYSADPLTWIGRLAGYAHARMDARDMARSEDGHILFEESHCLDGDTHTEWLPDITLPRPSLSGSELYSQSAKNWAAERAAVDVQFPTPEEIHSTLAAANSKSYDALVLGAKELELNVVARVGSDASSSAVLVQEPESLDCHLAFAGPRRADPSAALDDFIQNFKQSCLNYCGHTCVHGDFVTELKGIVQNSGWQGMKESLSKCNTLTVGGHFVGGAIAEIFAMCANSHPGNADYDEVRWALAAPARLTSIIGEEVTPANEVPTELKNLANDGGNFMRNHAGRRLHSSHAPSDGFKSPYDLFDFIDVNGDEVVDRNEIALISSEEGYSSGLLDPENTMPTALRKLEKGFLVFDANGDLQVTKQEFDTMVSDKIQNMSESNADTKNIMTGLENVVKKAPQSTSLLAMRVKEELKGLTTTMNMRWIWRRRRTSDPPVRRRRTRRRTRTRKENDGRVDYLLTIGAPATACPALTNFLTGDCFNGKRIYNSQTIPASFCAMGYCVIPSYKITDPVAWVANVIGFEHPSMSGEEFFHNPEFRADQLTCEPTTSRSKPGIGMVSTESLSLHSTATYVNGVMRWVPKFKGVEPGATLEDIHIRLCEASYLSDREIGKLARAVGARILARVKVRGSMGDEDSASLIQFDNTDCTIVFRGSDATWDFVNNAAGGCTDYCGHKCVHSGFVAELNGLVKSDDWQNKLKPKLSRCRLVKVAGHSLGGAMAEVFSMCANSNSNTEEYMKYIRWKEETPSLMPWGILPNVFKQ